MFAMLHNSKFRASRRALQRLNINFRDYIHDLRFKGGMHKSLGFKCLSKGFHKVPYIQDRIISYLYISVNEKEI